MELIKQFEYCLPNELPEKLFKILPEDYPIKKIKLLFFNKPDDETASAGRLFRWMGFPQHTTLTIHYDDYVLCVDRYETSFQMTRRSASHHEQYINGVIKYDPDSNRHNLTRGEDSFRGICEKVKEGESNKTLREYLAWLVPLVKRPYSLWNNCIPNGREGFDYLLETPTPRWTDIQSSSFSPARFLTNAISAYAHVNNSFISLFTSVSEHKHTDEQTPWKIPPSQIKSFALRLSLLRSEILGTRN